MEGLCDDRSKVLAFENEESGHGVGYDVFDLGHAFYQISINMLTCQHVNKLTGSSLDKVISSLLQVIEGVKAQVVEVVSK